MANYEAALAQLEKSKDNSGLPNWETLSQLQNSKDKPLSSGAAPNFDILLQQQLSQNAKEGGGKAGLLNWEALAQMQLQGQNSKDSLKNMPAGMPNLDLLLQLQLSKDSKGFPGWDALSLAQMQLAQSQLGKENQTKHPPSGMPGFDMLLQLQSLKDKAKNPPHGIPNFEALALAQLQLSQGMKDSKSLTNIPNFDSQLKDSYAKMGLTAIPNLETLMQLQMGGKLGKEQNKSLEALAQMSSKEGKAPPGGGFDPKDKMGLEALAQLQLGAKDGKSPLAGFSLDALSQFQMSQGKDCSKSAIPPFPNFEALALAQLQLAQGKDKGAFGGVPPNLEALAKFQMGQNSKEGLKNLIPGYESLQKDVPTKGNGEWDSDPGNKDKK